MKNNIKRNLILNLIILLGIILFFLFGYIFYKFFSGFFLNGKIYNNISKNIDYFIEFDLEYSEKISKFLLENNKNYKKIIPFYTPYLEYLNEIGFKKGAVIFFEGEKIDAIFSGNENKSIKFLEEISIGEKKIITKKNGFLISNNSPAPICKQNGKNLFCSKNKKILEKFILDINKGYILKKEKHFLEIENNLQISGNFLFGYANLGDKKNFPLIGEKFNSGGFTFWKNGSEIKGMFYSKFDKKFYQKNKKIFHKEKNIIDINENFDLKNTIFLAYSRNFSEKLESNFKYYKEKNGKIENLGKNIFEEKKHEIKEILNKNYGNKIIFKIKEDGDLIILNEKNIKNNIDYNLEKYLPKYSYSDEKIFINLEKMKKTFGINLLHNFKTFGGISKIFDDGIQIKILIK